MSPARLLVVVLLLAATPGDALGHQPSLLRPGVPFDVEEPEISKALYGEFSARDDVFRILLHYDTPFAEPFELLVPHRDELANHRPAYAIVGPGLPAPPARPALPPPLPDGWGAIVEANDEASRELVFESILRRVYWSSGPLAVIVPAGAAEVWVWSPHGTLGDFCLGFGVEEGPQDLADLFSNWRDYAY